MSFFFQERDWGLGNFVMATPMMQLQSKKIGRPIPTFFTNRQIASLYRDAPFVEILEKRPSGPNEYGSSRHPKKRLPGESDSEAYCRIHLKHSGEIPGTYVDRPDPFECDFERRNDRPHIAVFHGCLGEGLRKRKDIGAATRQSILDGISKRGMVPVLLGSQADIDNFWRHNGLKHCIHLAGKLSLRDSVSVLARCDAFISNDTGLYHVAGALGIPGMVLWRTTDPVKNRSTSDTIRHIIGKGNPQALHKENIESYLEELDGTIF